ncbi:ParB/RepB/Spo0J family partition protein [Oscillospiraceae bacterium OttesenSCG-928-F05]|nr:ParB/RepB/Spo0J family partition protein [Oscillospiraceae bacterium OttesenSCG-928-F05]
MKLVVCAFLLQKGRKTRRKVRLKALYISHSPDKMRTRQHEPDERGQAMLFQKRNSNFENNRITYIKTDNIVPNPGQPRKIFDSEGIRELAKSIKEYGILQPLTVRRKKDRIELIAGERRLRAARVCGLKEVPCIMLGIDEEQSAFVALIENLQRKDLDFIEEAEGIARLILTFGLSQEEAARRIGKSQSAVANKLRILKHSSDVLTMIREHGMTERHARALLRLSTQEDRLKAVQHIAQRNLNVSQTDSYIDELLAPKPAAGEDAKATYIIKDVRFFMNTVKKAAELMRSAGVDTQIKREEDEKSIKIVIDINK